MAAPSLSFDQLAALSVQFEVSALYSPRPDEVSLAAGVAATFNAEGEGRFEQVRDGFQAVLAECNVVSTDGTVPLPARAYGGFAFQDRVWAQEWSRFGAASFVLPRLHYHRLGNTARLGVLLEGDPRAADGEFRKQLAAALDFRTLLQSQTLDGPQGAPLPDDASLMLTAPPSSDGGRTYCDQVNDILVAIAANKVTKVVAARASRIRFDRSVDPVLSLGALRSQDSESTTFAFKRGESTFLGATPETLIQKLGHTVRSEALAGTFRIDAKDYAAEQLRSPKEHAEHAPVREAIISGLEPYCATLDYPQQPVVRELRHLLHLLTPVTGTLSGAHHVLDLVQALHPTPAVGGVPRSEAVKWIAEHENMDRGWYSGPVGWFDADGDGEFKVALRSGLVANCSATLFAGAGIVRGSIAGAEYQETELKLRSMRSSLRTRVQE